jgi:hypothetical protein
MQRLMHIERDVGRQRALSGEMGTLTNSDNAANAAKEEREEEQIPKENSAASNCRGDEETKT